MAHLLSSQLLESCVIRKRSGTVRRGGVGKVLATNEQLAGVLPYLSGILNSKIAIDINIKIIKIFVSLRKQISNNPNFIALKEQIKRIESEQENSKLYQQIDTKLITDKVTKLSGQVHQMSQILDEFQGSNKVIMRIESQPNQDNLNK